MADIVLDHFDQDEQLAVLGSQDLHLRHLRDSLGVKIVARTNAVSISGPDDKAQQAARILDQLRGRYRARQPINLDEVKLLLDPRVEARPAGASEIEIRSFAIKVRAKTEGQREYVNAIRDHDLTLCVGPAGSGKTYLAVATALESLLQRRIKRIVLVRPAVEAGEKLGFLPGDMQAKVNPYLRPLLDALRDMVDYHQVKSYMENDVIEIAPLAFMRGRTLNDSFIILDEAQNTTRPQMKMFLTRMGMNSKIVVTGDVTQVDLPAGVTNGLDDAIARLSRFPRVAIVRMHKQDIVRHPLVQQIVEAYETE